MNLANCRGHEAAVTKRVLLSLAVSLLTLNLGASFAAPSSVGSGGQESADVQARPFEIQGHRGAKGLAPENSIAAFEKAIALRVDTLEMDAQSTSDRVLVVYHGQKIDRARCRRADGGASRSKLLKDLSLEEVKAIRCEEGVGIPTLEEVLRLAHAAPYPVRVNVEIKMQKRSRGIPVGEFAALLVDVIDATGMRGRVLVQSFDAEALRSMRRIAPDIPRAVVASDRGSYFAMVEDTTASVLLPRRDRLHREDVEALHARGVAVIPWVVNDPEEMRRLRSWGVDGIITNRPDVAIEFRDGSAQGPTDAESTPPQRTARHGIYESMPLKKRERPLLAAARNSEALAELHGGLYRHPELNELIRKIGSRLAPPSTDPYLKYRFHILLGPHPGAFTLPDGQVYVTVGMLTLLENEAQLATLLAHEINHAAGHHGIQRYRSRRRKGGAFRAFWLALGVALESLDGFEDDDIEDIEDHWLLEPSRASLEEAYTEPAIRGYSRELEEEADGWAIRRVAEIGYDVRESARLYEILGRDPEEELVDIETKWHGHPRQLRKRAAALRRMASDLGKETDLDTLAVGAESYRDLRWQVSLDTVYKYIGAEDLRSAVSVAESLVEERKDDPEAHFALAEAQRAIGARRDLLGPAAVSASPRMKGPRLPAPDPMSGSIALTARSRAKGIRAGASAQEIFFVKLEEGSEAFGAVDLIPSSYTSKKQVYLFNAEPGRYVAVAAGLGTANKAELTAFFSMEMISATEVTVVPQEMVFMGDYLVTRSKLRLKKADPAQAHYYRLQNRDLVVLPGFPRMLTGWNIDATAPESVARDPATERGFWITARDEVFPHDPRWQALAARQLAAISEQGPD